MRSVGAFEAKTHFSALLDDVAHGEEIIITRHGQMVARLVPADAGHGQAAARAAVARILARSRGVTLGKDLSLKELIAEGRR
jgi:prevent-host-death family protein